MTQQDAYKLAVELKNKHGLYGWTVTFINSKRAFGKCNYTKMRISLSSLMLPYMTDEAIKDTIIHEIAHALCPNHNHDFYWKRTCIQLGGTGKRTDSIEEKCENAELARESFSKNSKYYLLCPVCGRKTPISRKPKKTYSCGNHGSTGFDSRYKMEIIQNY